MVAIWLHIMGLCNINISFFSVDPDNYSDSSPIVACISLKKFTEICKKQDSKTFLVLWRDVSSPSIEGGIKSLIRAILGDNAQSKIVELVIFSANYVNYADIFDKHYANVLSKHS